VSTVVGVSPIGSHAIAGEPLWGVITLVITSPESVVDTQTITATWTYDNSEGRAQSSYRVTLKTPGGTTLYDSGVQAGAGTSHPIPYSLANLSAYDVFVTVVASDGHSVTEDQRFTVQVLEDFEVDPNPLVGVLYEIGINGEGYMLADMVDAPEQMRHQRQVISLDSPRLATGDTPFNQAIERYGFMTYTDWTAGAGQRFGDRAGTDTSGWYASDNVDPFSPGKLTLLHTTEVLPFTSANNFATPRLLVVGTELYAQTDLNELSVLTDPADDTPTVFDLSAVTEILGLTTDGEHWYACDGSDIYRSDTAADPLTPWSTEDAVVLGWAGGRLFAGVKDTGSSTPNKFVSINASGAVEDTLLTLPAGWTIRGISGGGGYVWFGAYNGNVGYLYSWNLGSSEGAAIALELPIGEVPVDILWYQRQVLVRADRSGTPIIYRCPAEQGTTDLIQLAELTGGSAGAFCARGPLVHFSWADRTGGLDEDAQYSGIGTLDLTSGGYATGVRTSSTTTADVPSIALWGDRVVFAVDGDGIYVEDPTTYVANGWLKTSVSDGGSALEKSFDELIVQALPLVNAQTVSVQFTLDRGESYVGGTAFEMTGAGSYRIVERLPYRGPSIGSKIVLDNHASDSAFTPTVSLVQVRAHPLGLADQLVVVPVLCTDSPRNLQGGVIPGVPGDGARRARALEALTQTTATFQDTDWHITGNTETLEVVQATTTTWLVRDRHTGQAALGAVCALTLRKVAR
jgi:hypothetical protein